VRLNGATELDMHAPVRRNARGHLLPGARLNPGGRPVSAVTEIRARYSRRLPAIFDELMKMAMDSSLPPAAQLGAIRVALDYLLGRPEVMVTATHTSVSVADLYKAAMIKASRANSVPSEQVVEGKANEIDAGNGNARDPKEIQ